MSGVSSTGAHALHAKGVDPTHAVDHDTHELPVIAETNDLAFIPSDKVGDGLDYHDPISERQHVRTLVCV